jgi:hypothetical protein
LSLKFKPLTQARGQSICCFFSSAITRVNKNYFAGWILRPHLFTGTFSLDIVLYFSFYENNLLSSCSVWDIYKLIVKHSSTRTHTVSVIFPKAARPVSNEFPKAASRHIKGFPKATVVDVFLKISSFSFWRLSDNPVHMATSNFQ